tara:strand:+ start:246 stop:584 length:339 start_codon:yes stop_codon:yes gene_type:complete
VSGTHDIDVLKGDLSATKCDPVAIEKPAQLLAFNPLQSEPMTGQFRQLVVSEVRGQGLKLGDFAKAVAKRCGCNPETVSRFLRGTHDTSVDILEAMLGELGYEIPTKQRKEK